MEQYVIKGGNPLVGEVEIGGAKNAALAILSAAMMLRFSFDLDKEADAIEASVTKVLKDGYRTIDIMSEGKTQIGTARMGDEIAANI